MNQYSKLGIFLALILLLLTGCSSASASSATISPDQARMLVAQTVTAAIAKTQAVWATNTPAPTFTLTAAATESPTSAPESASPTPDAAQDSVPTPIPQQPQPAGCDNAAYVADVTIPDGADLDPGSDFTKTWQLKNTGTCTWDSTYAIGYAGGDLLGASSPTYLDVTAVAPGESVDISVAMVAPETVGSYTSYWQMQNGAGVGFGETVFVQINVLESLAFTYTPTASAEMTATASYTPEPTDTPEPTFSILPSDTPFTTATPTPTEELPPSDTPAPSETIAPIKTPIPTNTPTPEDVD